MKKGKGRINDFYLMEFPCEKLKLALEAHEKMEKSSFKMWRKFQPEYKFRLDRRAKILQIFLEKKYNALDEGTEQVFRSAFDINISKMYEYIE